MSDRNAVRAAISNAYYEARNAGRTMEAAADEATEAVLAIIAGAVAGAEDRLRARVVDYCEHAAGMAEENPDNPYAVGLARGYRDVAEKVEPVAVRGPNRLERMQADG
jgi:hypothetical protein